MHPNTNAWLQAVDYGAPATDPNWTTSDQLTIIYNRYIKNINGDIITVDAPVFNTLDRTLSQAYIYKYDRSGLLTNIGIENLRVDIEVIGTHSSPTDANGNEEHVWEAVELIRLEDSWVKDCTMIHFGHSGIMTSTASRITIENCKAIDPVSIIDGERRYSFNMYHASQLILVKNCYTRYGRHDYVSNGTTTVSGCVFYNCISEGIYNASEGHRWWSQGLLYDNITFNNPHASFVLGLYNRGDYGTSHGWAAVHSVAWNCSTGTSNIIIQKPPTAQNYAIGCFGKVTGIKPPAPFNQPQGYIEGTNISGLNPLSLYKAQLNERLSGTTKVDRPEISLPEKMFLEQNYPNPFNPDTTIEFSLPKSGFVTLKIYNLVGEEIVILISAELPQGKHKYIWDASRLASGVYLYRFKVDDFDRVKKLVLLK